MPGFFALTGTPGVGKTRVAWELGPRIEVVEVGPLAERARAGRRLASGWVVDLPTLRRWMRVHPPQQTTVVVGHLSHLLPAEGIVVLRCHPAELKRRLGRARRGTEEDRMANVVAEAIDSILVEALHSGARVWEVDTTARAPKEVAREVARIVAKRPRSRIGKVNWLQDPSVTAHLLA